MEEVQTPATADAPPQISSKNTEDLLLPPSPPPLAQTPPIAAAQTSETGEVILKNEETKRSENDRKYVWAGNYRPFYLQDFLCNRRIALWLQDVDITTNNSLSQSLNHRSFTNSKLSNEDRVILSPRKNPNNSSDFFISANYGVKFSSLLNKFTPIGLKSLERRIPRSTLHLPWHK
ncbi:unnamed protein product [Fraxinus pennsylvanica]|uniref:Uncharacterized protein n=1 Tax=Fraxinus pennsylvanica TaxID=56036 RepID=A0AAD2DRH5_9LAMI|nr:unnamed protein product [Fraxinus pennsylvanica]